MKNEEEYIKALLEELAAIPKGEFMIRLAARNTGHFCIHCKYRLKTETRRRCYCIAQPSNLTATGYKRIMAHDEACGLYQIKQSKRWQNL